MATKQREPIPSRLHKRQHLPIRREHPITSDSRSHIQQIHSHRGLFRIPKLLILQHRSTVTIIDIDRSSAKRN